MAKRDEISVNLSGDRASRGRSRSGAVAFALAIAGVWGTAAAAAAVGPEWEERIGADAGPLPDSAQVVGTVPGGTLASIRGRLAGANGAGPTSGDFQDMYLIEIVDVSAFQAIVSYPTGLVFDTQLFLFSADFLPGFGLLGNDEIAGGSPGPSQLLPAANDGSGFNIPTPGLYFLAISGSDSDPLSLFGQPIYNMPPGSVEISGADGPGATLGPVQDWTAPGEIGEYRISLDGCKLIQIDDPCPADFDGDAMVGFSDLLLLLAAWGPDCFTCPFDLTGDTVVGFDDLLIVLEQWGPCDDV